MALKCYGCNSLFSPSTDFGSLGCKFHPCEIAESLSMTEKTYSCCGKEKPSEGCLTIDHHVSKKERKACYDKPYKIVPLSVPKNKENALYVTEEFKGKKIKIMYGTDETMSIEIDAVQKEILRKYEEDNYTVLLPIRKREDAFNTHAPYKKTMYREYQKFIPFYIVPLVGKIN